MVKGIDNAFDHMELCFVIYRVGRTIISVKKQLALLRNYFHNRVQGSNFLLPTFLTGGNLSFQVANLLLATVNFEP